MKKLWWLLLLLSSCVWGQTPVTVTGTVFDAGGNLATSGYVEFDLQPQNSGIQYFVLGVGSIAPQSVQCGINGSGQVMSLSNLSNPCTVWGNDVITPANTTYSVQFVPAGVSTNTVAQECLSGSSYNLNSPKFCPAVAIYPQNTSINAPVIQGNLVPSAAGVFTLGSSLLPYASLYANNILGISSLSITGSASVGGNLTVSGTSTLASTTTKAINSIQVMNTSSDLGVQVNAAISALGSGGGEIYIPKGNYTFSTPINADNTNDITIRCAGGITSGSQPATFMTFTGSGAAPVSARSTKGFEFSGCVGAWSNASFVGPYIDLSHSTPNDSFGFKISRDTFIATGSGVDLNLIIDLDKVNTGKIEQSYFYNYKVAIRGAVDNTSYSNDVVLELNQFSSSTGSAETCHVQNPVEQWTFIVNTFEMGTAVGDPKVLCYTSGVMFSGLQFIGNDILDTTAGATATRIDIPANSTGITIEGGEIGGTSSTTAIAVGSFSSGVNVKGVKFVTHNTGVALGTSVTNFTVLGDAYSSVTTQVSGTPSSGIGHTGGSNQTTIWSSSQINLLGPIIQTGDFTATPVTRFRVVGRFESSTLGTVTNCVSAASPAVCVAAPAGMVVIAASSTSVVVNTTAVTANSEIQLQPDASLGLALSVTCNTTGSLLSASPWVSARTPGTSFTITINAAPSTNPECLSYRITN